MRHKINITTEVVIPEKPGYSIMFRRPKVGEWWGIVDTRSYSCGEPFNRVVLSPSMWTERNNITLYDVEYFVYVSNPKRIVFTPVIDQDGLHVYRKPRKGEWYQFATTGEMNMAKWDFENDSHYIYTRSEE